MIAHGESGWLVPRGDVEGLAAALAAALDDPERTHRLGLAGRERALGLTWERTARIVLERLAQGR